MPVLILHQGKGHSFLCTISSLAGGSFYPESATLSPYQEFILTFFRLSCPVNSSLVDNLCLSLLYGEIREKNVG